MSARVNTVQSSSVGPCERRDTSEQSECGAWNRDAPCGIPACRGTAEKKGAPLVRPLSLSLSLCRPRGPYVNAERTVRRTACGVRRAVSTVDELTVRCIRYLRTDGRLIGGRAIDAPRSAAAPDLAFNAMHSLLVARCSLRPMFRCSDVGCSTTVAVRFPFFHLHFTDNSDCLFILLIGLIEY